MFANINSIGLNRQHGRINVRQEPQAYVRQEPQAYVRRRSVQSSLQATMGTHEYHRRRWLLRLRQDVASY